MPWGFLPAPSESAGGRGVGGDGQEEGTQVALVPPGRWVGIQPPGCAPPPGKPQEIQGGGRAGSRTAPCGFLGYFFAGNAEWVNIIDRRGKYTKRRLRTNVYSHSECQVTVKQGNCCYRRETPQYRN